MSSSSPLLVIVTVSGWVLALPAVAVDELVHEPLLVRPPQAPNVLAGLFDLRGRVVPVLRPDLLLDLPPPSPGLFRVLAVFNKSADGPWALLVERALSVVTADEVRPVPPGHTLGECVTGLLSVAEYEGAVVVDPSRLLRRSEARMLAQLAERERERLREFSLGDA